MDRTLVASRNIRSIGYDIQNQVLEVEFHKGLRVYQYLNVPFSLYLAVSEADSVGASFAALIQRGGFESREVTEA